MTSTIAMVNSAAASTITSTLTATLVVIDPSVTDAQFLASGVLSGANVLVLESERDGVAQITLALQQHPEITNVHIVAHGSPACLNLGNHQLNLETIDQYAWDLQAWFSSSSRRSTSLSLYACNVASGDAGHEFLQKLHTFTGANIYASTQAIGNTQLGGNWQLDTACTDAKVAGVQPTLPCEVAVLQAYAGVLANPILANAIGSQLVVKDTVFSIVLPNNTFFDADNTPLTYTATLADGTPLPSWISFSNGTFTGTPNSSNVGSFNIKVTASDGTASVSDTFTLNVASSLRPALVKDINPGTGGSNPYYLTNVNDTLYFVATDSTNGRELWKIDPATGTASLVKDINPGTGGSNPYNLTNINGTLYFTATDSTNGTELWKVDPATGTDSLVKDINPGTGGSNPYYLTNINGTLYFTATDSTNGTELWKIDLATGTASLVKDINPGTANSNPTNLTNVNSTLYFTATDSTNGTELWKIDPATGTASLVKDINPGTGSSSPYYLTNINGTLYFIATDSTNGTELWKVDPTTGTASLVKDINPGTGNSNPYYLTNVNGTLYFTATDSTNGQELWKVDPATGTASLVKDINPGTGGSSPYNLTNVNGTLYFTATDSTNGRELWKVDPATGTASLVKDINPGTGSSSPYYLTNVNGTLYFQVRDSNFKSELWKVDPTTGIASLVQKTNLDPIFGDPATTNINGTLYFAVNDSTTGTELWHMAHNTAPTMQNTIGTQTANPGSSFTFALPANTFADAEHDPLTYTATLADGTALPTWLTLNNGTFSGTPGTNDVGSLSVKVIASDGIETGSTTFSLNITPPNTAPTLQTPIAIQTATEDSLFTFTIPAGTFTDVENDAITYTAKQVLPDNSETDLPSWISFDGTTFNGTPAQSDVSNLTIKLIASDATGSSNTTFTLNINSVNDAPAAITLDKLTVSENSPSMEVGNVTVTDPDSSNFTFAVSDDRFEVVNNKLKLKDGVSLNHETEPTLSLKITATDDGALTKEVPFTLTVTNTNDAPTISGTPATSIGQDTLYEFTPIVSDEDTDTLTYSIQNKPSWATFDDKTGKLSGTPTQADLGMTENIVISVTDSHSDPVNLAAFNLSVDNVNDAPTIGGTPTTTVDEDSPYTFTPAATDPDFGTTLTYSITNKPDWATFDTTTGTLSGTPNNSHVGITENITIQVSDGEKTATLPAFTLKVNNTNDAPTVATPIADQTAKAGEAFSFAVPTTTFNDIDAGDTLSLSATLADGNPLPTWLSFDAATGKFNGTPDAAATLTLKVTATDQAKATMSDEFVLSIAAAPVSNPISDPVPVPVPVPLDGDAGVIPSTSFEKITKRIQGTPKADKLTGSNANDLLNGKGKNDRLKGQGGDDWLIGGKGDDRLNGGAGNDRMDGSQGQDKLLGGKGDDRLLGGLGKDTLIGGGGNDVYVFNNNLAFNTDVIIGFEAASELIDLRPIFAKAGYQGATLAQVVRLEQIGSDTQVQIDTDGLGSGTSFAAIATLQNVAVGAIGSRNFVIG